MKKEISKKIMLILSLVALQGCGKDEETSKVPLNKETSLKAKNNSVEKETTTKEKEATTKEKEATTKEKEATTKEKEATTKEKEATTKEKEATTKEKEATTKEKEATTKEKEATTKEKEATTKEKEVVNNSIEKVSATQLKKEQEKEKQDYEEKKKEVKVLTKKTEDELSDAIINPINKKAKELEIEDMITEDVSSLEKMLNSTTENIYESYANGDDIKLNDTIDASKITKEINSCNTAMELSEVMQTIDSNSVYKLIVKE